MPKLRRDRVPDDKCDERVNYHLKLSDNVEVIVGVVWKPRHSRGYSARCTHPHFGRYVGDDFRDRDAAEKALLRQLNQYRVIDIAYDPAAKTGVFLDGRGNPLPDGSPPVYLTFRVSTDAKNSRGERYEPQPKNREEVTL